MANETNSPEKLWDLIRHIRFAMFTTRHENGHLHSRPMTTQNGKDDEDDRLWFFMSRRGDPVGVDDPDLALVEVTITHGHYWDVKENKVAQLFKMGKAAVTGRPPKDMGETGEVRMH